MKLTILAGVALATSSLLAAPVPQQLTFPTPAEAIHALVVAAEHNDSAALVQLFGPEGKDILESGDPVQDKQMRAEFALAANEKLHLEQDPDDPDRLIFAVGDQDWPFPVPLIRQAGTWRLDPVGGRLEVLARRIGRNELTTMELCRGFVEAQLEYSSADRDHGGILQYARQIGALRSADGALALVTPGFVAASFPALPGAKPEAYHGYYFRVLSSQGPAASGGEFDYLVHGKMIGGFALIAWPAEYGVSGIQTFIVNHEGVLYGQDLGPKTATAAAQITRFNPEKSWRRIELE